SAFLLASAMARDGGARRDRNLRLTNVGDARAEESYCTTGWELPQRDRRPRGTTAGAGQREAAGTRSLAGGDAWLLLPPCPICDPTRKRGHCARPFHHLLLRCGSGWLG